MSEEITGGKTRIKKIQSIIEEINGLNADSVPKIKEYSVKLIEMLESSDNDRTNKLNVIDANNDEKNALINKVSQNQRDIKNLEENIDELTSERNELMEKIQVNQKEMEETQGKIIQRKEELDTRSKRLEELEARVEEAKALHDEIEAKLKNLEEQLTKDLEKKKEFSKSFENRVAAMKSLIEKDYIRSHQLQFIKSLQLNTALELKNISAGSDISEDLLKKYINQMIKANGPIEYDPKNETVTLKKEVDI